MSDAITRHFEPDLEVRAAGDGRTIAGIVVPFGRVAKVSDGGPSYDESFRRGAFARTIEHAKASNRTIKLLSQHNARSNPLGRAVELREASRGLYGEFRVSKTRDGDDALELVRDGALDSFSVGFAPVSHVSEKGVTVRTEVKLREASLVTFPAYEEAVIMGVRSTLDALANLTPEERAELIEALRLDPTTRDSDSGGPDTASALVQQAGPAEDHPARNIELAWEMFLADAKKATNT